MRNTFSALVVDDMRRGRIMEKNKWKVDSVESFKRRNYMVQDSADAPSESEASGDETSQYSIKSSIDDELPELVVFLEETNYEFVEDICIDKAVTSDGEFFEENCDSKNGYVSCLLKYDIAGSDSGSTEESEDLESSISSTESTQILEKDFFDEVNEKQKVHSDAIDEIPSDLSYKKTMPKLLLDRKAAGKNAAATTNSIEILSNKILDENKHKGKAAGRSNIERGSIFHNSGLSVSGSIGSGWTVDRRDFHSLSVSGSIGSGWTVDHRDFHKCWAADYRDCHECCGSTSMADNYELENQTGPYTSHDFVYQREDGLPALDPEANSVTKPSLSSYSGSVSLRSNSSTNSSHSFAFPVLQTEWNGSPERMINGDQMQTRRSRLWRICFPCCNF